MKIDELIKNRRAFLFSSPIRLKYKIVLNEGKPRRCIVEISFHRRFSFKKLEEFSKRKDFMHNYICARLFFLRNLRLTINFFFPMSMIDVENCTIARGISMIDIQIQIGIFKISNLIYISKSKLYSVSIYAMYICVCNTHICICVFANVIHIFLPSFRLF